MNLRSVTKVIYLVDELYDLPSNQEEIQPYLDDKILKITDKLKTKWEIAYKCWKYSCCNHKLYIDNPSLPLKTRNRFQKEINKINKQKINNNNGNNNSNTNSSEIAKKDDDSKKTKKSRNKLRGIDINFDKPVYRTHCDRKGSHQWTSLLIEKEIAAPIHDILGFQVNLKFFDIEVFSYCRDNIMLYGVSIISDLYVRNRITSEYGTILNNCICYLVGKLADIKDNMVVMDPMCGLGSIIIECKMAFGDKLKQVKYIGSDIQSKAIKQAMVNAKYCNIKVNDMDIENKESESMINFKDCDMMEFYNWDITQLNDKQMKQECIDIIISDLPFGHKCGTHKTNRKLYPVMLKSMNRILKMNGKALLITTERKLLAKLLDVNDKQWKYDTIEIDVGGFDALLFVMIKIGKYEQESISTVQEKGKQKIVDNDMYERQRKMSLDSQ